MENQDQIPGVDDEQPALPQVDELTALKERADLMGIQYHPSIGLEKLRAKINEAITTEGAPKRAEDAPVAAPVAVPTQAYQAESLAPVPEKAAPVLEKRTFLTPKQHADAESVPVEGETLSQKRVRLKRHANELIRIRVTCMNPAKKEWEGEIISVGNSLVKTISKYVPFGIDEGWHVPRILYNVLRDRQAQIFVTVTDEKGNKVRKGKLIKEFAIEVLEPLTKEELAELAARQAASRSVDA
jgi:hypothetical protein